MILLNQIVVVLKRLRKLIKIAKIIKIVIIKKKIIK
jgi:hypothetical protein